MSGNTVNNRNVESLSMPTIDLYTDESQIREQLGLSQIGLSQDLHLELQSTQTGNNVNSNSA